jgi:hypothetical protein
MHGGTLCLVHANHAFETIDVPVSQGSTRIVYAPLVDLKSDVDGCASGENMRRKLASAFKCLTVSDMADWSRDQSGQGPRQKRRSSQAMTGWSFVLLGCCRGRGFPRWMG